MSPSTPRRSPVNGFDAVDAELKLATAETLGRLGRALEEALAALRAFDAGGGAAPPEPPRGGALAADAAATRGRLLARAGEALLFYVVQREVMGLRAGREILDELGVPAEVRRRMALDPSRGRG